jgi:hypothetical protein
LIAIWQRLVNLTLEGLVCVITMASLPANWPRGGGAKNLRVRT